MHHVLCHGLQTKRVVTHFFKLTLYMFRREERKKIKIIVISKLNQLLSMTPALTPEASTTSQIPKIPTL